MGTGMTPVTDMQKLTGGMIKQPKNCPFIIKKSCILLERIQAGRD